MRTGQHCLTPLAAVAAGLLAGAVGTVCLDAVHYLEYRRGGGTESPLAWEFAPAYGAGTGGMFWLLAQGLGYPSTESGGSSTCRGQPMANSLTRP